MVSTKPPPNNRGFGLGEPFDSRANLLVTWDAAKRELSRAETDGTRDEIAASRLALAVAEADVENHRQHIASLGLMLIRFAVEDRPDIVSELIAGLPVVTELADAIVRKERKGVRR